MGKAAHTLRGENRWKDLKNGSALRVTAVDFSASLLPPSSDVLFKTPEPKAGLVKGCSCG